MNNQYEKVSIIVPIYKVEKFIRKCVDSLLAQDYQNYEIILIDDGSPDSCGEICDEYAKKDNRIQVIHQKNAGVSAARNAGLNLAKGRFVTFVDPDDWVDIDYLQTLVSIMQPNGMAVCGLINEYESNPRKMQEQYYEDILSIEMNRMQAQMSVIRLDGICGYCHSKMFDMKIIKENAIRFHEEITLCEDHLFVMQYLSCADGMTRWNTHATYHYRQHAESVVNSRFRKTEAFDPKIFSMLTALQIEERYIERDSELVHALAARQVGAMADRLRILVINQWYSMPYYRKFLKDVRAGLHLYLRCDIGQSAKSRIGIILCSISPRIYCFIWKLYGGIKREYQN